MANDSTGLDNHRVVSHSDWLAARTALLAREKEFTRLRDPKLESYRRRMGWTFKWLSSFENDFNFDLGVTFTPEEVTSKQAFYNFARQDPHNSQREGISVFYRDANLRVFHTYSTYARGIDAMSVDYQYLDLVPKGRDENGRGPYWVRRHDEYGPRERT